jgi:hypothetical protein
MANHRHSAALGCHVAFETVGQIVITDFVQSGDDLLLSGVGDFHFVLGCHAGIYTARSSEPGFSVDRGRWR